MCLMFLAFAEVVRELDQQIAISGDTPVEVDLIVTPEGQARQRDVREEDETKVRCMDAMPHFANCAIDRARCRRCVAS